MTDTVLIRLSGPLQSWGGHESRVYHRATHSRPTKSGVLGIAASALGRSRTDPVDDLAALRFAVRCDQTEVATHLRDYQTTRINEGRTTAFTRPTERYYLQDHVFVAALEGDPELIAVIDAALRVPRLGPLFLGRRSCVPDAPLHMGLLHGKSAVDALREAPWQAREDVQRKQWKSEFAECLIYRDGLPGEDGTRLYDSPLSFDTNRRDYSWRTEVREPEPAFLPNPEHVPHAVPAADHNPLNLFDGSDG